MDSRAFVMPEEAPEGWAATLVHAAANLDVDLTGDALTKLATYASLLRRRASHEGLMSERAVNELDRHLLDSIAICRAVPVDGPSLRAVDVGSGAGLPGVVVAILRPRLSFTLLDAGRRRIRFLHDVAADVAGLTIEPLQMRAEIAGQGALRETFDLAVARALAPMPTLVELVLPLVSVGGALLAHKTCRAKGEIESAAYAIEVCGGSPARINPYSLPDRDVERLIVTVRKRSSTPAIYPRRDGVPKRRPLLFS